jgi:hypothetical protein
MPEIIPDLNTPIRSYRAITGRVLAVQLTPDNLVEVADWISDNGVKCDQWAGHLAFPAPWAALQAGQLQHAEPGDWVLATGGGSGFWVEEDAAFVGLWKVVEHEEPPPAPAEDLPPGEFARIELPGRREHTGWITEETRFGVQMAVVRNWDGVVLAEVAMGPGCQKVNLATPLRRPEPARARFALPSSRDPREEDDPYGCEDDDTGYDSAGVTG